MTKSSISLALVSLAALSAGCSYYARGPEDYAKDTQQVLETRAADIKNCYDGLLKTDATTAGQVTIKFMVKAETGDIANVEVDPANTTAPESLSMCVINALQGLKLAPPDERNGIASFTWDFQVGAAAMPMPTAPDAAPPMAPVQ